MQADESRVWRKLETLLAWPGLVPVLAAVIMMNVATLPHHPPGVLSLIMLRSEV